MTTKTKTTTKVRTTPKMKMTSKIKTTPNMKMTQKMKIASKLKDNPKNEDDPKIDNNLHFSGPFLFWCCLLFRGCLHLWGFWISYTSSGNTLTVSSIIIRIVAKKIELKIFNLGPMANIFVMMNNFGDYLKNAAKAG